MSQFQRHERVKDKIITTETTQMTSFSVHVYSVSSKNEWISEMESSLVSNQSILLILRMTGQGLQVMAAHLCPKTKSRLSFVKILRSKMLKMKD